MGGEYHVTLSLDKEIPKNLRTLYLKSLTHKENITKRYKVISNISFNLG